MAEVFQTDGIVLKTIKYGETSVISTIYTSLFGLQTYLIRGVRRARNNQSHLYQPGSFLEMQVYHNELKHLQYIKECNWKVIFQTIFIDVVKNSITQLMMELVQKSIKGEEQNQALFDFLQNELIRLDQAPSSEIANIPVNFMAQMPEFLGFRIQNNYSEKEPYFSPVDGRFTSNESGNQVELDKILNVALSHILHRKISLKINGSIRRRILHLLEKFYQFQIDGFTECRTLKIIETFVD